MNDGTGFFRRADYPLGLSHGDTAARSDSLRAYDEAYDKVNDEGARKGIPFPPPPSPCLGASVRAFFIRIASRICHTASQALPRTKARRAIRTYCPYSICLK